VRRNRLKLKRRARRKPERQIMTTNVDDHAESMLRDEVKDIDGSSKIAVFSLANTGKSVRTIMAENYGITHNNSRNNPDNKEDLQYVNSGLWGKHRNPDGSLSVTVGVGCHCKHDCCGHMCRLEYTFQLMDGKLIVLTQTARNV